MDAIRNIYEIMPDTIDVPEHLRRKKAEVIMLPLEDSEFSVIKNKNSISDFYGSIPDMPEREHQGEYENRDIL